MSSPLPAPTSHDQFVHKAGRIFHGSTVVISKTFEQAKEDVLAMLREHNKHKAPLDRWISACRVFYDLHRLNTDEPHKSWAARVLDEDLTSLLQVLHKARLATDYTSAWPDRWTTLPVDDCPF